VIAPGGLIALAPGKVNLCLFLGPTRDDGRHQLLSLLESVSLADELRLTAGGPGPDVVHCPGVEGPNLAEAALAAYRRAARWDAPPLRLEVRKAVPVAAGMGGGSGDAAAALRLAAHAAGRPGDPLLAELAFALGADVPAQIEPRRVMVRGAGELVEPLGPGPAHGLVVVPSAHRLATTAVFAEADRLGLLRGATELSELDQHLSEALRLGNELEPEWLHNDLQPAARSLCPEIGAALEDVAAAGARAALVSGSGPTVFGVFPGHSGPEAARAAAGELRGRHAGAVAVTAVGPEFGRPRELAEPGPGPAS